MNKYIMVDRYTIAKNILSHHILSSDTVDLILEYFGDDKKRWSRNLKRHNLQELDLLYLRRHVMFDDGSLCRYWLRHCWSQFMYRQYDMTVINPEYLQTIEEWIIAVPDDMPLQEKMDEARVADMYFTGQLLEYDISPHMTRKRFMLEWISDQRAIRDARRATLSLMN